MSKDFDSTLSNAIDVAAGAAQTAGASAARTRGRTRTMRKRIALCTTALVIIAGGTTAAFAVSTTPGHGAPPIPAAPSISVRPSHTATGTPTVTATTASPTSGTSTGPATNGSPSGVPSTGTGSNTGSTSTDTGTSASPGTSTTSSIPAEPFPGIWDITSWQQYRTFQASVAQGHQPWLTDPASVVAAWAADSVSATPPVHQIATNVYQVTKPGTTTVYTIHGIVPDPGSGPAIWVITSISPA